MSEQKAEFPYAKQSCSGSERSFSVEARYVGTGAMKAGQQTYTDDWQTIHFQEHPAGIPTTKSKHEFAAPYFGLMTFQAAQALRWWFHASLASERLDICFETRIVEHRIKYSLEEEAVAAHLVMGNSDGLDRSFGTEYPPKEITK